MSRNRYNHKNDMPKDTLRKAMGTVKDGADRAMSGMNSAAKQNSQEGEKSPEQYAIDKAAQKTKDGINKAANLVKKGTPKEKKAEGSIGNPKVKPQEHIKKEAQPTDDHAESRRGQRDTSSEPQYSQPKRNEERQQSVKSSPKKREEAKEQNAASEDFREKNIRAESDRPNVTFVETAEIHKDASRFEKSERSSHERQNRVSPNVRRDKSVSGNTTSRQFVEKLKSENGVTAERKTEKNCEASHKPSDKLKKEKFESEKKKVSERKRESVIGTGKEKRNLKQPTPSLKESGNNVKFHTEKVKEANTSLKTSSQASKTVSNAGKGMKKAAQAAGSATGVGTVAKVVTAIGKKIGKTVKSAAEKRHSEGGITFKAGGLVTLVLVIAIPILFLSVFAFGASRSTARNINLSEEVLAFMPDIREACERHGIGEYAPAVAAIMMQESGGRADEVGGDVMQAAESQGMPAGTAIDPIVSIDYGVLHFKECLELAKMPSPVDIKEMSLAFQGYNYGTGYITWALPKGGYTEENAIEFSNLQASRLGWGSYGDKKYVEHVLRYYIVASGSAFEIVNIALDQVGNRGEQYWRWYGLSSRDEWCAIFVSWCANEAGLIDKGIIPRFASCTSEGMVWFKAHGQWMETPYIPRAGDIIFFDNDGSGDADHVGIVTSYDGGVISTVEGNAYGDSVRENTYFVGDSSIRGYGVPAY